MMYNKLQCGKKLLCNIFIKNYIKLSYVIYKLFNKDLLYDNMSSRSEQMIIIFSIKNVSTFFIQNITFLYNIYNII